MFLLTAGERISCVAHIAGADGLMIRHITAGIEATGTHARIAALLADAGLGGSTFRIDGTLGSTVWWLANESGCTRAGWVAVELLALRVGSTR